MVAALNYVDLVHLLLDAPRNDAEAVRLECLAQDTVSRVCKKCQGTTFE